MPKELSLIDEILLETSQSSYSEINDLNILEFVEEILDLGYELSKEQKLILKTFYNLELDESDIAHLEYWKSESEDRTTYDFGLMYQTLILESGRGSGKTTLGAIMSLYAFYFCLTKEHPHKWFRDHGCSLGNSTAIDILILATGQEQTTKGIFAEVSAMLTDSTYFKTLVDAGKIDVTLTQISSKEKRTRIRAGHSNSRSQVGGSILLLVLDEAVRFEDDKGENNALLILRNVGKGTQRFASFGRRLVISSAWEEGDVMVQLYEGAKGSAATLGYRLTTFHMNPLMYRERPDIADTYKEKFEWSQLEYEGIRTANQQGFFDKKIVEEAFVGLSDLIVEETSICENEVNYIGLEIISGLKASKYPAFAHIDYGIVNDATTLAVGYVDPFTYKIVIDYLLVWKPRIDRELGLIKPNIENIENCVLAIHEERKIETLTFDQFNSEATIQKLNRMGINTRRDFTTAKQKEEYTAFRRLLQNNKIVFPTNSRWTDLLKTEMTRLMLKNNTKIDHPAKGSKDLIDACMAVGNLCQQWKINFNICPDEARNEPLVNSIKIDKPNPFGNKPEEKMNSRERLRNLQSFLAH
jgi:hypothetical protein